MSSAIYEGRVVHTRLRPRRHKLRYRVFSLLLDLGEADAPLRLRLLGINRPAPLSFWESDHGDGEATGLRQWVLRQLDGVGISLARPRIEVLCYPRIFGYVFNPLTAYFCADGDLGLRAIIYEVSNTFGERRAYVMPAMERNGTVEHECDKTLYVSPFVPMDCRYHFRIRPPGDKVLLHIDETDKEGLLLRASFSGVAAPLTDAALLRVLLTYPLMTLKVIGAIHWEALRLWLKGVPMFHHRKAA